MILTITLNPAVDMSYEMNTLVVDGVNRCNKVIKTAGGKGLNVSRVISLVNENVSATGFLGGANGKFISDQLAEGKIENQFISIDGETRNCIAILHEGNQTEILESGPSISEAEVARFLERYEALVQDQEIVVASGSAPKELGADFYKRLVEISNKYDKKFLLDTSGEGLKNSLAARPYLIKPNMEELSQLVGKDVVDEATVIEAVQELSGYDIPYIVVSMGAAGAIALVNGRLYKVEPPKINAVNPVGSGDATIAGIAVALKNNQDIVHTLKFGCVLGTLNALEQQTGYVDVTRVDEFMNAMLVEPIMM